MEISRKYEIKKVKKKELTCCESAETSLIRSEVEMLCLLSFFVSQMNNINIERKKGRGKIP